MEARSKRLLVLVIVIGFIFSMLLLFLVPVNFGNLFQGDEVMNIIFIGLPILFAIIFVITLIYFINQRALIKTITLENQNVLGRKSTFNNMYAFQKAVYRASRFRAKQHQHIVAFSFSNLVVWFHPWCFLNLFIQTKRTNHEFNL